jgi:hypothetical protein
VIAKKLLRTRKEYGVSEELKELIHLEEEGLQIGQVITIPSKNVPKKHL